MVITPGWSVSKKIGPYGPFKMDKRFAFSNFSRWGSAHNRGFVACIEEAGGMRTVFDIGAHIGLVSLPLSMSIDQCGKLFAFEPAESNRAFLENHIRDNGIHNIEIISDLVGDEAVESVRFFESPADSGMNTIAESRRRSGFVETDVKQITLDAFCNKRDLRPELIKIDTEGAELNILRGASGVLRKYHPIIFLSVHPQHVAELGGSVEELEELLTRLGYVVNDMDGNIVRPTELTEYVLRPA
jgi:FkbM family methyltransferase